MNTPDCDCVEVGTKGKIPKYCVEHLKRNVQQEMGWEVEYDKYVRALMRSNNDMLFRGATQGIKKLIGRLLKAQKAQESERVVKIIEHEKEVHTAQCDGKFDHANDFADSVLVALKESA